MATAYWEVASYGYPNPFSQAANVRDAWETLLSFQAHSSYAALKSYWSLAPGGRPLSAHAVESWKAAFEEFGLLYVLRGEDTIRVTPGGEQLIAAGHKGEAEEFARIGLSLLLRYPLRGARRSRTHPLSTSDLLPYWLLYAAMRELDNELWQEELKRLLCKVTRAGDAQDALDNIKAVRAQSVALSSFPLPVAEERGKFYNTINQVTVHGSLSYLVFGREAAINPSTGLNDVRFFLPSRWGDLVDAVLGGSAVGDGCDRASRFVARMPSAGSFGDEPAYFAYLGAGVPPLVADAEVPTLGDVAVLAENRHYQRIALAAGALPGGHIRISGPLAILCRLSRDQRVILEHDLVRTYKVVEKQRAASDTIAVTLRQAVPITSAAAVREVLRAAKEAATPPSQLPEAAKDEEQP